MRRKSVPINVDVNLRLRQYGAMTKWGILAYDPKQRKTPLAGPLRVQVQTIDRCNALCLMCPYSASEKSGPPERMEERLYVQILSELKQAGTVRSFLPMLQNEPLVDREIAKRVRQAGGYGFSPYGHKRSLLTSKRADNLLEAGTDSFSVSIDAFREETYRSIRKGLGFSRVIGNVQSLLQCDPRPLVFARFLKQRANAGEEKMFMRYWKAHGARPFVHSVVNRAGTLDSFDRVEEREARLMRRLVRRVLGSIFPLCPYPFLSLNVLWDGRVILCCHDWGPGVIVGDLSKQSLTTVWNGEAINHYRHLLYRNRSEESPSCANCSCRNGLWGPKSRKYPSRA